MKRNNFFNQSAVLISRYLKIFFNDKQSLSLTILLPILTIIVVTLVASGKMFSNKVENKINDAYPLLSWEIVEYEDSIDDTDENSETDEESTFKVWDGTVPQVPQLVPLDEDGKSYSINSPSDLQFIANAKGEWLQKEYYLNCDIDMDGKTILPIGTDDEPFTGTFNGSGHIVKNFVLKTDDDCIGFFGKIEGKDTLVSNLGIEDSKINGSDSAKSVGIVVGTVQDATVENCYTKSCEINTNNNNIGGIAGIILGNNDSLIQNCYSRAKIISKGDNVGGIVGAVNAGSVKYTYFAGEISSTDGKNHGAIIGKIENDESCDNTTKCIYDKDIITDLSAVGNTTDDNEKKFKENDVIGWKTEKLQNNASLIRNLDKHLDDDESNGSFKNDGELYDFVGTQTGLFMLACVAIFVGICNSIQEICKERNILKREYMTNLRLGSYITSKLVVQGLICAVQILLIMLIFFISVCNKDLPYSGVIFGSAMIEMYISMFLIAFASDTIALLISSVVKNSSTANTFIPIVLIVQIVFSGVLFELGETMEFFAGIMISKWGISALAATCHLNEGRLALLLENPEMSLQMGEQMSRTEDLYTATSQNLLLIWGILLIFIVLSATLSGVLLTRVKKDKR